MLSQRAIDKDNLFSSSSDKSYEDWRLTTALDRARLLGLAVRPLALLTGNTTKATRLFELLLAQADKLDKVLPMQGATGESNVLYLAPRGKTLVMGLEGAETLPILGQLLAALLTGNEAALYYPSQSDTAHTALEHFRQIGLNESIIRLDDEEGDTPLLFDPMLAQVAVVGTLCAARALAAELSDKEGVITQVITVTDVVGCREMLMPDYLLRFCTERVKTVNTTAIGGNASLLELGE